MDALDAELLALRLDGFLASLPKQYRSATLDAFDAARAREQHALVARWALAYPDVEAGLYLHGGTGTGKTHLAVAAAIAAAAKGAACRYASIPRLLERVRFGYENGERVDIGTMARYADVLVLDDLGAQRPTEWAVEQTYVLLDAACSRGTRLLVTSNLSYKTLAERYGRRIASRVMGATRPVAFDGVEDYRIYSCRRRIDADAL